MLVCDTSALIAYFDTSDVNCAAVTAALEGDEGPFIVSPYVIAELDYLLATRHGVDSELAALAELTGGAWDLAAVEVSELREISKVIDRYRDQNIGAADGSLVVLAHRYRTDRILTLDHRHFQVLRTLNGKPFTLIP